MLLCVNRRRSSCKFLYKELCLFVEYSGLKPLTSTLPFILSIKLCTLPAGFIVEAKSQLASSHSSLMN